MKKRMLLLTAMAVAGCGGPERQQETNPKEAESVFEPLVGEVRKARAVEDVAAGRKREIDDALGEVDEPPDGGRR